tara:strand:+ start:184054 stop:184431 length:378 start_codon:yes stop_codon:yes gene_type:complete
VKTSHSIKVFLLLSIILFNSFKVAGFLGYYIVFTDSFVEKFCINKDRPQLECNGKCALSKMLIQENEEKKEPLSSSFLKYEIVYFFKALINTEYLVATINSTVAVEYHNLYSFNFSERIAHPPKV